MERVGEKRLMYLNMGILIDLTRSFSGFAMVKVLPVPNSP